MTRADPERKDVALLQLKPIQRSTDDRVERRYTRTVDSPVDEPRNGPISTSRKNRPIGPSSPSDSACFAIDMPVTGANAMGLLGLIHHIRDIEIHDHPIERFSSIVLIDGRLGTNRLESSFSGLESRASEPALTLRIRPAYVPSRCNAHSRRGGNFGGPSDGAAAIGDVSGNG